MTQQLIRLARQQHGVFTSRQAFEVGFSAKQMRVRTARGEWSRVFHGLYRLAAVPLNHAARLMGACLTLPGSVASHEAAAQLRRFPYLNRTVPAVVCVGPDGRSGSPLARVHRYDGLGPEDVSIVDGIPTTSVALTLFHLSAVIPAELLERIVDDRLSAKAVEMDDLLALADYWTRRGRPRRRVMRAILARRGEGYIPPESALEFEFLKLLRTFALPEPVRQSPLPWHSPSEGRVDFFFPQAGLVVEVDGRRWHTREQAFVADRQRDRAAQLEGLMVLRYTWAEVTRRPRTVATELRRALAAR